MTRRIDLDLDGWWLEPVVRVTDGPVVGYIENHPRRDDGEPCRGALWIGEPNTPGGPMWTQASDDPITLRPSIACRSCGRHYFITGGHVVLAE